MNVLLESETYRRWTKESGLRQGSIDTYKAGLKRFGEFIVEQGFAPLENLDFANFIHSHTTGRCYPIDVQFIDAFVASLVEAGVTPSSLRSTVDGLKSLFTFLFDVGIMERNILLCYPNRFYTPKLRDRALVYSEVLALLDSARELAEESEEDYYLLLLLLVTCGLRAGEVCELREDQIRWEDHIIIVNRGQKTEAAVVYMSTDLEEELKLLVKHDKWYKRKQRDVNPHVFYYRGKPLRYQTLRAMIDKVVLATDPALDVTPHTFRYTMAALLCDQGVNVKAIQEQMRHKRLSTTFHYLGINARDARQIIEENTRRMLPGLPEMIERLRYLQ